MEPLILISTVGAVLTTLIEYDKSLFGEVSGGRADALFSRLTGKVVERLKGADRQTNHDLQRAVRKAQLQATIGVCESLLAELGHNPSRRFSGVPGLRRVMDWKAGTDTEVRWALHVRQELEAELDDLEKKKYEPPSTEAEAQIELLLQPRHLAAEERVRELKESLIELTLRELRLRFPSPPARFIAMMRDGWDQAGEDGAACRLDWFGGLCNGFACELKVNQRVANIFQSNILAELPLTLDAFTARLEQFGEGVSRNLQLIDARLAQLGEGQEAGFQVLREQIGRTLPALAMLPDVAAGQERLLALHEMLLRQQRRQTLSQRYAERETVGRIEELLREHTGLLVGRDGTLSRLNRFLTDNQSGRLVITGGAGFGKTAVLANWVAARRRRHLFTAYHFFNHRYETTSLNRCYRNLLRQLFVYYELSDEALPDNEDSLRDVLYGMLEQRGTREDEPLVIVLDGLDEAENPFSPPFMKELPEGVFLVVSARAEPDHTPEYLLRWVEGAQRLSLDRLPRPAIADWLLRAGRGELATFASDESFVARVEEKTEGFPLYMHHLADELVRRAEAGEDVRLLLEQTPRGFHSYVGEQFRSLWRSGGERLRAAWRLFTLLSVVKSALRKDEVQDLTGMESPDLAALPWQVTRWFNIGEHEETYAFSHPLLANEFACEFSREARQARERLSAYCADWRANRSRYALRHYAEYLREENRYAELYELGRDAEFRQAQSAAFPDDPTLLLQTMRTVLAGASEATDAGAMAEFMLAYVELRTYLASEMSPLDALAAGDLNKALVLSENYNAQTAVLWKLLLAWRLCREGRAAEARPVLQQFVTRKVYRMDKSGMNFATTLLSRLRGVEEAELLNVSSKLLDDFYLAGLAVSLAGRGENGFRLALRLLSGLGRTERRAKALGGIALKMARWGDWERALECMERMEAMQTSGPPAQRQFAWSPYWVCAGTLTRLVGVALRRDDVAQAERFIEAIKRLRQKSDRAGGTIDLNWQLTVSLVAVAGHLFEADRERALHLLEEAEAYADKCSRWAHRGRAYADLMRVYAEVGLPELSEKARARAYGVVNSLRVDNKSYDAARVLIHLGSAFLRGGASARAQRMFEEAAAVAEDVPEEKTRFEILNAAARKLAALGKTEEARRVAARIGDFALSLGPSVEMTKSLIRRGETEQAYSFVAGQGPKRRAWLLSEIGLMLLKRKANAEAERVLCQSLSLHSQLSAKNVSFQIVQTWSDLAGAYASARTPEGQRKALGLIERATSFGKAGANRYIWTLIDLAEALALAGDMAVCHWFLKEARGELPRIASSERKVWLLAEMAKSAQELGLTDLARDLLRDAQCEVEFVNGSAQSARALSEIGEAFALVGDIEQARDCLRKAYEEAERIRSGMERVRARTVARVALSYAKAAFLSHREGVFVGEARELAARPELENIAYTRRALAMVLAVEGQGEQAIAEARRIDTLEEHADTLRDIAILEAESGRPERAVQIARMIVSERNTAIYRIAKAVIKAGSETSFKELLQYNANFGAAFIMIGLLAQLYPAQAEQIERVVITHYKKYEVANQP